MHGCVRACVRVCVCVSVRVSVCMHICVIERMLQVIERAQLLVDSARPFRDSLDAGRVFAKHVQADD